MHRLKAIVRGRVQGVGFRWYVLRRAEELGVKGHVRNLPDGSVEVDAEGGRLALSSLLEVLRVGPGQARVEGVDELWSEGPGRHRDFRLE